MSYLAPRIGYEVVSWADSLVKRKGKSFGGDTTLCKL